MLEVRTPQGLDDAFSAFRGQFVEVTIPSWASLTEIQRQRVEAGEPWPIVMHVQGADDALLDNLVERAIEAWISAVNE